MAVPKRKKSKSRSKMRRGSNGSYRADLPNVTTDPTSGGYKTSHNISEDGYYKGRKIIADKAKSKSEEVEA
jgi:large subunit ribosomal protein L32